MPDPLPGLPTLPPCPRTSPGARLQCGAWRRDMSTWRSDLTTHALMPCQIFFVEMFQGMQQAVGEGMIQQLTAQLDPQTTGSSSSRHLNPHTPTLVLATTHAFLLSLTPCAPDPLLPRRCAHPAPSRAFRLLLKGLSCAHPLHTHIHTHTHPVHTHTHPVHMPWTCLCTGMSTACLVHCSAQENLHGGAAASHA